MLIAFFCSSASRHVVSVIVKLTLDVVECAYKLNPKKRKVLNYSNFTKKEPKQTEQKTGYISLK